MGSFVQKAFKSANAICLHLASSRSCDPMSAIGGKRPFANLCSVTQFGIMVTALNLRTALRDCAKVSSKHKVSRKVVCHKSRVRIQLA